jgi:hypothetical protein
MSSNLIWEPTHRQTKDLGTGIKFILRKIYTEPVSVTLTESDVGMLQTIIASTSDPKAAKDASNLIEAIEKHGSIEVTEVY